MSYFTGEKLTRFQVSFINISFAGLAATSLLGGWTLLERMMLLQKRLAILNPIHMSNTDNGVTTTYIYLGFRALVIIGCFLFMGQVRNGSMSRQNT